MLTLSLAGWIWAIAPAQAQPSPSLTQTSLVVENISIPISIVTLAPQEGWRFRPLLAQAGSLQGLSLLSTFAPQQGAIAAINGGFFNRITQQPLGAIRVDRTWISSPILGRGVVAWSDNGEFAFERLRFLAYVQNSLTGAQWPLVSLNSGYLSPGLAQYTSQWGLSYTTQTDEEVLVVVDHQVVAAIYPSGVAGSVKIPLGPDRYVIVGRQSIGQEQARQLELGQPLQVMVQLDPPELDRFDHLLGAGPLLLKQGEIVLDAELERFQPGFRTQRAARSVLGQTPTGQILLVTIGRAQEGSGLTLLETAQLMLQLGCREALNLDGGSSSTLYHERRIVNLSPDPSWAPLVHNAFGVFSP